MKVLIAVNVIKCIFLQDKIKYVVVCTDTFFSLSLEILKLLIQIGSFPFFVQLAEFRMLAFGGTYLVMWNFILLIGSIIISLEDLTFN